MEIYTLARNTKFDIEQFANDLDSFKKTNKLKWKDIFAGIGAYGKYVWNMKVNNIYPKTDVFLRACKLMEKDPMIYLKQT